MQRHLDLIRLASFLFFIKKKKESEKAPRLDPLGLFGAKLLSVAPKYFLEPSPVRGPPHVRNIEKKKTMVPWPAPVRGAPLSEKYFFLKKKVGKCLRGPPY